MNVVVTEEYGFRMLYNLQFKTTIHTAVTSVITSEASQWNVQNM
jgi:hypothetical protein